MATRDLDRFRVLVVTTSPETRRILRRHLVALSVQDIRTVHRGWEGLAQAQALKPDVVVVDGDQDLDDALEFVSGLRTTCDVPVVLTASDTGETIIRRAQESGVDGLLAKPLSPATVYLSLVGVIENVRAGSEETFGDQGGHPVETLGLV